MGDKCEGECGADRERPLVACEGCGRHVLREAMSCPFCSRAPSRLRGALVAAAFFGSAAIAGCAYGPPPDDEDGGDTSSEVSAGDSNDVPDSTGPENVD